MPPIFSLPQDLIEQLGITEVHDCFQGAQKYVFIVSRGNEKFALKMFRYRFNERDERELDFYLENKHLDGIPRVVEVVLYKGETVVIEEYIEGLPLNKMLRLKWEDSSIKTFVQGLCGVMEPIWQEGKTHRDLKPENIIVTTGGGIYVIDFGIYKNPEDSTITTTGFQPHTTGFAAPEQLSGDRDAISYRTDFFSIGIIAYVMKYSSLPFGSTEDEIRATFAADSFDYNVDDDCSLKKFFEKIFVKNISLRPRTVNLFLEEL
ncbi:serine/threonine protein kinase [Pseudodesulfovibrio piezophilus]|uniref:Putative [Myosin light-chain] kinase n=1 Tax=Pseudodesulfovibrio piezophilus (strain DSM 21447 / JCM 15486 / C1TLV30) TaxID=1322246 RepID=M1WQT2_PSEP2|nr:protein kinase [Pseudodesulfovibrio piezophilus]CCH47862.1 putative [Myosin light-chain] kinase [Pseudodesulfovibrio piezophilus C1TLV30]